MRALGSGRFQTRAAARESAARAAAAWTHPVGVVVDVRLDSGEVLRTKTRSEAAVIGETAVIWLDGISGCYALDRVTFVAEQLQLVDAAGRVRP